MTGVVAPEATIGFLGPRGTFTEEALLSDPGLAHAELRPYKSFVHVLDAVTAGEVDYGFVAIENSIEGTVSVTLDQLVFDQDLFVVGEVVLPVSQNLVAPPGTALADIKRVVSFPHATAQCRTWLGANLPDAEELAVTSTAEAVRLLGSGGTNTEPPGAGHSGAGYSGGPQSGVADGHTAAIGTTLAASLYGLEVLAAEIEDHPENTTRFVLVTRPERGIPAPTGHDKTSVVCFQSSDHPGSLHGILGQFSARDLNLVKLESRPTKKGLGEYCFIIDFEGHVADAVVADCLRDLHAGLRSVKFLGSYAAAGPSGPEVRRQATEAWEKADRWIHDIRRHIEGGGQ